MSKSNPPAPARTLPFKKGRGLGAFYRDVIREMRHVNWPTFQEALRLTWIVLAVCTIIIVLLTLLTQAFSVLLDMIIRGGVG